MIGADLGFRLASSVKENGFVRLFRRLRLFGCPASSDSSQKTCSRSKGRSDATCGDKQDRLDTSPPPHQLTGIFILEAPTDCADLIDREAATACGGSACQYIVTGTRNGANPMRYGMALALSIAMYAPANAAHHHPPRHHVINRPDQGVTAPGRFAVPGWSDESTRQWLDNASSGWQGG